MSRAAPLAPLLAPIILLLGACFPLGIEDGEALNYEEPLLVMGGLVYDGKGGPPIEEGSILVRGGRIQAIGLKSQIELPSVARVVVARAGAVLPGLVDLRGRAVCERDAGGALATLKRSLASGVTTIVDEAGPEPLARVLSEWVVDHPGPWPSLVVGAGRKEGSAESRREGQDPCAAPAPAGPAAILGGMLGAGEPPEKAVSAVTLEAARKAGLESAIGSLEPGKRADIVVLEGAIGAGSPEPPRAAEILVGGVLAGRAARTDPTREERSSLRLSFFLTRLARPSLWCR